jgi:hypothetical protein
MVTHRWMKRRPDAPNKKRPPSRTEDKKNDEQPGANKQHRSNRAIIDVFRPFACNPLISLDSGK